VHLYVGGLGLARLCKWVVLTGPARHDRPLTVSCSCKGWSPLGGPARHGYIIELSRAGLNRARVGPGRALVEKGSTPAGRYIFSDGSSYPPTVLFLVAVS
jgi:hypothetical protein